jgi:multiple sugar transport system ATP-binding protein
MMTGILDETGNFRDDTRELTLDLKGYLPAGMPPGEYVLGIRPENIHGDNNLHIPSYCPVSVFTEVVEPMGSDSYIYFKIGQLSLIARLRPETAPAEQQSATLYIDRSKLHFFDATSGENVRN